MQNNREDDEEDEEEPEEQNWLPLAWAALMESIEDEKTKEKTPEP